MSTSPPLGFAVLMALAFSCGSTPGPTDAGGSAGGNAGGSAGGSAGGTAGGSAGGSAGGAAGGSAGGSAGGTAGGAAPDITGTTGNCPAVTPCAGALQGTWFYTAACADDPIADFRSLCSGLTLISTGGTLHGRVVFSGSSVTREGGVNATSVVDFPLSCAPLNSCTALQASLSLSVPTATCSTISTGCSCSLSTSSSFQETGTFVATAGVITITTNTKTRTFDSCVTGNSMVLRETTTGLTSTERGTTTLGRQ